MTPERRELRNVSGTYEEVASQFLKGDVSTEESKLPPSSAYYESKGNSRMIAGSNIFINNLGVTLQQPGNQEWANVIEWLVPVNEGSRSLQTAIQTEAEGQYQEGTCQWFLNSQCFENWNNGKTSPLWMHGGVGTGKTVLLTAIVSKLSLSSINAQSRLAYFYSAVRHSSQQPLSLILRYLIAQLCPTDHIPTVLLELYKECTRQSWNPKPPSLQRLTSVLQNMLEYFEGLESKYKTFILIDALDEIPWYQRGELLRCLNDLATVNLASVRILVTSRTNQPDIQRAFTTQEWSTIELVESLVQPDINEFVSQRLKRNENLMRILRPHPNVLKDLLERVGNGSHGMFRLAYLQLRALERRALTIDTVKAKLNSLPQGLNESYELILGEIDSDLQDMASNALIWITTANRPMFVEEVVEAATVTAKDLPFRREPLDPQGLYEVLNDLVSIQPMLSYGPTIEPKTHVITVSHPSVREFLCGKSEDMSISLRQKFYIDRDRSHLFLARSCLAYLYYFNNEDHRHEDMPLLTYCYYHWDSHVKDMQRTKEQIEDNMIFRRHATRLYSALVEANSAPTDGGSSIPANFDSVLDWMSEPGISGLCACLNVLYSVSFVVDIDDQRDSAAISGTAITGVDITIHDTDTRAPSYLSRSPYRALPDVDGSFRLFELEPALSVDVEIRGRLIVANVNDCPMFSALSYFWGDVSVSGSVLLNGVQRWVPPNLDRLCRFLRTRHEKAASLLFIDALCVNMLDLEEKNRLVPLMGQIFSKASEVLIGLGPGNVDNISAVHRLSTLTHKVDQMSGMETSNTSSIQFPNVSPDEWHEISNLIEDPWWTRLWVIPEVVYAGQLTIVKGMLSFNFYAIETIVDNLPALARASPALATSYSDRTWSAAAQLVATRKDKQQGRALTMPQLLWRFKHARGRDPRDRAFALMGMCSSGHRPNLVADYSRTDQEFATTVAFWMIQTYGNLDILSITSVSTFYPVSRRWPSWVPDFSFADSRLNPLVLGIFGGPDCPRPYCVAGSYDTVAADIDSFSEGVLRINGWTLDQISVTSSHLYTEFLGGQLTATLYRRFLHPSISQDALATKIDRTCEVELFWRTLVADQYPPDGRLSKDGIQLSNGARFPPLNAQEESILIDGLRSSRLGELRSSRLGEYETSAILVFVNSRKLYLTSQGFLGIASEKIKEGDSIIIAPGGAVPYIIRPRDDGTWAFISDCYIHGHMDGDLVEDLNLEDMQTFRIS